MTEKQITLLYDVFFINGARTRVEIIGSPDKPYPFCRILNRGPYSKYKRGQKTHIWRGILHRTQKRKYRRKQK